MADFLLSIVGLAALGGAIFEFYKFVTDSNRALMLFLRHVNKEEEIHITQ